MNPTVITCPACGSENLESLSETRCAIVPYGPPVGYSAAYHRCNECHEEGDFADENESALATAEKKAVDNSMCAMIDYLANSGVTMAHFERALSLPQRTVARWKAGASSAPAVALMRVVRTYPWMLEVADSNFDQDHARRVLLEQAAAVFHSVLKKAALVPLAASANVCEDVQGIVHFDGQLTLARGQFSSTGTAVASNGVQQIRLIEAEDK